MEKTKEKILEKMFQQGEAFYNETDIMWAMEEYASQRINAVNLSAIINGYLQMKPIEHHGLDEHDMAEYIIDQLHLK